MGYVREDILKQTTEKAACYSFHYLSKVKGFLVFKYNVHNIWTVDPDNIDSRSSSTSF